MLHFRGFAEGSEGSIAGREHGCEQPGAAEVCKVGALRLKGGMESGEETHTLRWKMVDL